MVGGAVAHPAATPKPRLMILRLRSGQAFPSRDSSARGLLSSAPFAVYLVVAVAVQQYQVGVPVVCPVTVPWAVLSGLLCTLRVGLTWIPQKHKTTADWEVRYFLATARVQG